MPKKINTEMFLTRVKEKFPDNTDDLSKVVYEKRNKKAIFICPKHGEYMMTPSNYLNGQRCPKCCGKGNTQESIIKKFKEIHGDKYNYDKVEFKSVDKKVCIICSIHGEFWQEPRSHINGYGCKYCAGKEMNTEEFIRRAKLKHGDKYDYTKANFVDSKTDICIICTEHGEFFQKPNNHLSGNGCPKCGYITVHNKRKFSNNTFIDLARKVHGDKYDYSKAEYYNIDTNVCIICPKHEEFWQTPYKHINCKRGCQKCKSSHMENDIRKLLMENNIKFVEQKKFGWLGLQSLDFYLPNEHIAIECQGGQHFLPVEYWGGEEAFNKVIERDRVKKERCNEHNIKILYYADYEFDFPYKIYRNGNELINEINKINYGTTNSKENKGDKT